MAQSSKPRSASSASNKRKYQPERAHVRSPRQVRPSTPRVLDPSPNSDSPAGGRSNAGRGSSRYGARGTRNSSGSSRRARGSASKNKQRGARRRRGIGFWIAIGIAVLAVLIGGFVALYFSSLFTITNIEVQGNEKLQSAYVIERAEVPEDSTFLRTDVASIKARLMAEPWVKNVEVERIFPSTLILHITEQPVAAIVDIVPETALSSTQRWAIAEDGTWITQVDNTTTAEDESQASSNETEGQSVDENTGESADESATEDAAESTGDSTGESVVGVQLSAEELVQIPKIKDVSAAVQPVAGVIETDEGITNALALLKGFSDEMRAMVSTISAPDAGNTNLTLYNNVSVAFGAAVDIEAKEQAIATLLAEHEGTITSINVRVADRPSFRSTEY